MKNVLVTGGAGFIGSYLVDKLIKLNANVIIVDKLLGYGAIPYIHPKATFINANICDIFLYSKLKDLNIDTVYHLAAQSAGETSYDDPKFDILTNSYGTYLIAQFCKDNDVKRLIYTSTVAVYGNNASGLIDEKSNINPDSIYGVSKYSGELFIRQILSNSNTQFTIFRLSNTYGLGENLNFQKKGMVSIYIGYIWKKKPISVKGSLERYRDFTFVTDTVDALISCHKKSISYGEIYNLSSGVKTHIKDLLNSILIAFNLPKDYKIKQLPGTPGDSFGFHPNSDKIKKHLNWSPKIELNVGLKKYYKWVKSIPIVSKLDPFHPFLKLR